MKKKTRFIFFISLLFMFSCQPEVVYQSTYDFSHESWNSFEKPGFRYIVMNTSPEYDFYLKLVYTSSFPKEYLTFASQLISSGGEERLRNFHVKLRNKEDVYKAFPEEVVYTKKILLGKGIRFEKQGACVIRLENRMSKMQTEGIKQIELEIVKN